MLRPWPLHSMCCCRNHFLLFFIHFCRVMATAKIQPQKMMWKSGTAVWLFDAAMWLLELHYDWKFLLCMFELRLWVSELGWVVTMMHFSALTFLERSKWPDVSLTRFWKPFWPHTWTCVFGQQVVAQRSRFATTGLSYNYSRWILTGLHFVLTSLFGCWFYFDPVGTLFGVVFGFDHFDRLGFKHFSNEHVRFGVWKLGFRDF